MACKAISTKILLMTLFDVIAVGIFILITVMYDFKICSVEKYNDISITIFYILMIPICASYIFICAVHFSFIICNTKICPIFIYGYKSYSIVILIHAYMMLAFIITIMTYAFKCHHETKEQVGGTYVLAVMIYTFSISLKNVFIVLKLNT